LHLDGRILPADLRQPCTKALDCRFGGSLFAGRARAEIERLNFLKLIAKLLFSDPE
jgi:hypothetical protein